MCLKPRNKPVGMAKYMDLPTNPRENPINISTTNTLTSEIEFTSSGNGFDAENLLGYLAANNSRTQTKSLRELRKEIIHRDNYMCSLCGCMDGKLSVHPIYNDPRKRIREMESESLITFCKDCWTVYRDELPKLAGLIAINILRGDIDVSTLNERQ